MQKIKKFWRVVSGDILKKVHFWAKFDLLNPLDGGQEFF